MKQNDLKLDKRLIYAFIIVIILIFGLFFLNQYFDISTSSFSVKHSNSNSFENKITGDAKDVDYVDEKLKNYFDK